MPTRTPDTHPFDQPGTPTREQLLAYAQGRLPPAEQHAMEAYMERDPMLRDAVDGLQQPGAVDALYTLDRMRPVAPRGTHTAWWIAGGAAAVIAVIGAVYFTSQVPEQEKVVAQEPVDVENAHSTPNTSATLPLENAEINASVEQPVRDRIGHEPLALHTYEAAQMTILRETGVERVDPRKAELEREPSRTSVRPARRTHSSLQLLFVHDLKLVHPKELYGNDPQLDLVDEHVAARFADQGARDSLRSQDKLVPYTQFMDDALGRFSENDHKGCLDDLRFVLTQYPDDVNALFYAGLCAYNLGLYDRARDLLHRAATHPVDVFDEEAAWYHALTLERLNDPGTTVAFQRIANGDGFYSELAKARVFSR